MKLIFLTLIIFFTTRVFCEDLLFNLDGKQVEKVLLKKIQTGKIQFKNGEISAHSIKLFNVFRGYEKTYEGYDFYELLDLVYGKTWKQKEKITFTSLDGYHQIALISAMLNLTKNKVGYLAFKEKDQKGFTPVIKDGVKIDPGPLYLVWTHFSVSDKASHGDIIKWPYQLSAIDIE